MNDIPLPKLLRQARKAVSKKEYHEAEALYASIVQFPQMADDLDVRLRYAYCAEKAGNLKQAIKTYNEAVTVYHQSGEEGAAAALEKVIEVLKNRPAEEETLQQEEPEAEHEVEALDDAELMRQLCEMGELISLSPGDMLCHEGDMPHTLWLMRSGSLTIHLPDYDEPDIITVKNSHLTLVGEIGFFTNQRRGADVEVAAAAELFAINSTDISRREKSDPAFRAAMERLAVERWAEPVLAHHAVFERINDIDRKRLMGAFKRISVEPGKILIEEGEEHANTYMLQSGCLFFMHTHPDEGFETRDGSMTVSIFPGEMIHLGGLLKGYKSEYRVLTATPVRLLRLSQADFEAFTLRRPWIIQAILQFSQRPAHLQIMRPEDDYLWKADRHVKMEGMV
ncbi:MAG: cyclic nucleotide-binding domain-containing protein [Mariprofundaceae bacterium]|nr:cyclic nucleotide-binding domain-containing protein [Mariprofundaceae bacterium]